MNKAGARKYAIDLILRHAGRRELVNGVGLLPLGLDFELKVVIKVSTIRKKR